MNHCTGASIDHYWRKLYVKDDVITYKCSVCGMIYQRPYNQPLVITHQNYDEHIK